MYRVLVINGRLGYFSLLILLIFLCGVVYGKANQLTTGLDIWAPAFWVIFNQWGGGALWIMKEFLDIELIFLHEKYYSEPDMEFVKKFRDRSFWAKKFRKKRPFRNFC